MAKMGYAAIYMIIVVMMIVFLVKLGRNKDKKDIFLKAQIYLFVAADLLYMSSFFIANTTVLTMVHCGLLILEVWIVFLFLQFGLEYTKIHQTPKRIIAAVAGVLCVFDSNIVIYNMISGRLFDFVSSDWNDSVFLKVQVNPWYLIHLILIFDMHMLNVVLFYRRAYIVPSIFKNKYAAIGTCLLMGFVISGFFRYFTGFTMFPVLIFLTYGECIYFVLYCYIPVQRKLKMNNFVVEKSVSPVLLFDGEDELQVYNKAAEEILGVKMSLTMDEFIEDNNLRFILTQERRRQGKTKEFTLTTTIGELSFLIHGQELYDEKKRFIGTLFIYNDITSQERLKEETTFHATRDSLTGMWNRDFFFEVAEKELFENPDIPFVMISSDVHGFLMFNEILGKKTGDDLLLSIANGFQERCREHWVIGRIAGDRFAMIMPKNDFNEQRFLEFSQTVFEKRGYSLKVHLYIGVYEIVDRSLSATEMYDRTYMAIETIKGSMRDTIAYYDDNFRRQRMQETITIDEMEKAIREKEFVVYLQPQVDSVTNKVVGSEALVRWMSKEKGMVAPVEFIPLFESNGMITKLDFYVWEEVCQILRRWKEDGHPERTISVNISAKDFYLTDLYTNITGLVEKYDINPRCLKLEITETAFALDVLEQSRLVSKFRDYGFTIEIDDFGSGYSSLNSLKDIEVDVLKLDMKFFERSFHPERAQKVVESMVSLAYNLNMPVVAEGVETEEDVLTLQKLGCDIIQGYFYAKPMPIDDFEKYIEVYPFEDFSEIYYRMRKRIS